jgi:four helix bundle protein
MIDFKNLAFWKKAHLVALRIYIATKKFPKEEIYGLTSQMRRSAISIPSNIAEGCGRNTKPQLNNFLAISAGSTSELQYQVLVAFELGYLNDDEYSYLDSELTEIRKMIFAYSGKL